MKKKSISDYITNWHKTIIALIFFITYICNEKHREVMDA